MDLGVATWVGLVLSPCAWWWSTFVVAVTASPFKAAVGRRHDIWWREPPQMAAADFHPCAWTKQLGPIVQGHLERFVTQILSPVEILSMQQGLDEGTLGHTHINQPKCSGSSSICVVAPGCTLNMSLLVRQHTVMDGECGGQDPVCTVRLGWMIFTKKREWSSTGSRRMVWFVASSIFMA